MHTQRKIWLLSGLTISFAGIVMLLAGVYQMAWIIKVDQESTDTWLVLFISTIGMLLIGWFGISSGFSDLKNFKKAQLIEDDNHPSFMYTYLIAGIIMTVMGLTFDIIIAYSLTRAAIVGFKNPDWISMTIFLVVVSSVSVLLTYWGAKLVFKAHNIYRKDKLHGRR